MSLNRIGVALALAGYCTKLGPGSEIHSAGATFTSAMFVISIQLSSFFGFLFSVSYFLVVHLKFFDSWNPGPQLPSEPEFCGAYTSCAVWSCFVHDKKGFNLFPPIFLLNLCSLDSLK